MLPAASPCSWSPLCHNLCQKSIVSYWKQLLFQFIKMKETHYNFHIICYFLVEMFINEEEKWSERKRRYSPSPIHIYFVPILAAGFGICWYYFGTSTLHLPPCHSGREHGMSSKKKNQLPINLHSPCKHPAVIPVSSPNAITRVDVLVKTWF